MAGDQQAFKLAMDQGNTAAWDQLWDQAARYYRLALEHFPDHPEALSHLGLALYEQQKYDEALTIVIRVAQVSPGDPVPVEKAARILEMKGFKKEAVAASLQAADLYLKARDADKAIDNFNRVIGLMPDHLLAHTRLAMIYERTGRKADAVTEYLAAAGIMQRSGDLAKAMQAVEYTLQLLPDSLDAMHALTLLRTNQPLPRPTHSRPPVTGSLQPLTAAANGTHALELTMPEEAGRDPIVEAQSKAMVALAALLFDQEEESSTSGGTIARRSLNSLTRGTGGLSVEAGERARILLHLGQAIDSQTHGENAQAAEELERCVEVGLRHPAAFFNLGFLNTGRDNARALRYLQKSVKHPEYALASYLLMGRLNEKDGNYSEAGAAYLQALRLADCLTAPESADEIRQLYEPIIEVQSRQTDVAELKTLCNSISHQLVRPDWRAYLKMARNQLPVQAPGSPPLPLAEMLLESRSSQVVEALAYVRQLSDLNKLPSAMEEAYNALHLAPTYLPLHVQIGELLLKDNRTTDAVDKFMLVAELYSLRGEATQAIRLFNRVIQIAPMDLTVRSRLIDLQIAQGRVEEALQQYMNLAEIYYSLAEFDMARQTFSAALKVAQQSKTNRIWSVQILNKVADIDLQRLDWRAAMRVYEQLRTLAPDDAANRANLVSLNFRMGQDATALSEIDSFLSYLATAGRRADAVDFLSTVLVDWPNHLEVRKRLAEVHVRLGQNAEAVKQLDSMADALMAMGNRAGSIAIVQSIISLNPPNVEEYKQVLNRLRNG